MQPTKNDRDFSRVVTVASALGLGFMASFIYSLKAVHPALRFQFTFGCVIVGLLMAAATWVFFSVMFQQSEKLDSESSPGAASPRAKFLGRWVLVFVVVVGLITAGGFVRALRGVADNKMREVIEGALGAILFVSVLGYLLWRVVRHLESDTDGTETRDDDSAPPEDKDERGPS